MVRIGAARAPRAPKVSTHRVTKAPAGRARARRQAVCLPRACNKQFAIRQVMIRRLSLIASGGTDGVIVTNTVLQALGVSASDVRGGYAANGNFVGLGAFDAVITINIDQPYTYTEPVPVYDGHNVTYDATRAVEHEIDEVLGGGGSGSTLNYVSQFGTDNPDSVFTFYQGALDLYRYSAPETPSFSTSEAAGAYLSINGGASEIVGFNNFPQGDYGDFGPNIDSCAGGGFGGPAGLIQDAFSCNSETAEKFTSVSPEYSMLESIGYDPTVVPEASTWLMLLVGFGGLGFAGHRRVRELGSGLIDQSQRRRLRRYRLPTSRCGRSGR